MLVSIEGPFKGNIRDIFGITGNTTNQEHTFLCIIWQLGCPRSVQNTPTGCGNHFHTMQTSFRELVFFGVVTVTLANFRNGAKYYESQVLGAQGLKLAGAVPTAYLGYASAMAGVPRGTSSMT